MEDIDFLQNTTEETTLDISNLDLGLEEEELGTYLGGTRIRITDKSSSSSWNYQPLYSQSVLGKTLVWQIGFDEEKESLVMFWGQEPGKKQKEYTKVEIKGNNTLQEQALILARQKYMLKVKSGYHPLNQPLPDIYDNCKPCLATIYKMPGSISGETTAKGNLIKGHMSYLPEERQGNEEWPCVAVDAKLDGIRALISIKEGRIFIRSRGNNEFSHLNELREQIEDFFVYLPPGSILDGELYHPNMSFNEITSAVKTVKTRHPQNCELIFYCFDIIESDMLCFRERRELLFSAIERYTEDGHVPLNFLILPYVLAYSHNEILQYLDGYEKLGYEGIMVRQLTSDKVKNMHEEDMNKAQLREFRRSKYKPGRSQNIFKLKNFLDKEVTVIGGKEGKGSNRGTVVFRVKDEFGNEFDVKPQGERELTKRWLQELPSLIGKLYTIKYQELHKDTNIPRFPTGVGFREDL